MKGDQSSLKRSTRHDVAEHVRNLIRSLGLRAGDALPGYCELAAQTGVSYLTVKRGMDVLAAEGLIRRAPSRGSFLARNLTPAPRELKRLGVIYPSSRQRLFRAPYLVQIMQGIAEALPQKADMHVFSICEEGMVRAAQLGEWMVDGALLINVENEEYLRTFANWGIPGVVVDYRPSSVPLDFVACDNAAAAQGAVAHLARLGHRRVVFAGMPETAAMPVRSARDADRILLLRLPSDVQERHDASVDALRSAGMLAAEFRAPAGTQAAVWAREMARQAAELWRGPGPKPTALMTNSSLYATDLLMELEQHGLRAPEDLSFCTVAAESDLTHAGRAVTACRFDFVGMGRAAVRRLTERCGMPDSGGPRETRIGFELVMGETTRKAAKGT